MPIESSWKVPIEKIPEHLSTYNSDIVKELFQIVKSLHASESDRHKTLDTKAASLFGLVGILVSACAVALSIKSDDPYSMVLKTWIGKSFTIVLMILLLFSIIYLYKAVRVSQSRSAPGDVDLFETIAELDGRHLHVNCCDAASILSQERGTASDGHNYRRFLCEHFWKLYRFAFDANETKAMFLATGQNFVFLALVAIIAFQIYAVIQIHVMSESKTQPSAVITPAQSPIPQAISAISPSPVGSTPPPLKVSSSGNLITNSQSPTPIKASSAGQNIRLGEGSTSQESKSTNGSK